MTVYRLPVITTGPQAGGPWINVWHFRVDSTGSGLGNVQTQIGHIRSFYDALTTTIPEIGPILAPGMHIDAEFATDVQTQEQVAATWQTVQTGGFGQSAPTRLSMVVAWKTSIAARRARGRTFIPPMQKAVQDAQGLPDSRVVDALQAAGQALVNASLADDFGATGIYGLETAGGGPDAPHVLRDIQGASVKRHFATLRTRG